MTKRCSLNNIANASHANVQSDFKLKKKNNVVFVFLYTISAIIKWDNSNDLCTFVCTGTLSLLDPMNYSLYSTLIGSNNWI